MIIKIFCGLTLVCAFHTYSMDTDYISVKGLVFVHGYQYIQLLRKEDVHTIELPKQKFEMIQQVCKLPLDIQNYIKLWLGTGALKSLWAHSYTQYKKLLSRTELLYQGSEGKHHPLGALAYAPNGLLASACNNYHTTWLWHPTTHKLLGALKKSEEETRTLSFLSNDQLAIGLSNFIELYDVNTQVCSKKLIEHNDGEHMQKIVTIGDKTLLALDIFEWQKAVTHWHIQDGTYTHLGVDATEYPTDIAVANDGTTCAIGREFGNVELWDFRKPDTYFFRYHPDYRQPIDSLAFLTPTLIASGQSSKAVLSFCDITRKSPYDKTKKWIRGFGDSCYYVHNMCRMNNTTLVATVREHNENNTALRIFDLARGYIKHIPVNISSYHPLACGPNNTIATGSGTVKLFRPALPSLPDDVGDIPLATYALAAMKDTYEDNLIDDPDYSEDNV